VVRRGRLGLPDRRERLLRPVDPRLELRAAVPAADCSPAVTMAWATASSHGRDSDEDIPVTRCHDNGTHFASHHFRAVADAAEDLGITLSRTACREADGDTFIE
jgi:hypothetical protein